MLVQVKKPLFAQKFLTQHQSNYFALIYLQDPLES